MQIYTVIPFSKGGSKETLTYFGPDGIESGEIVSIPIRKRTGRGLVIEKRNVTASKSEIKSKTFTLKKIWKIRSGRLLSAEFIASAEETARYYAATTGAILRAVLPETLLQNIGKLKFVGSVRKNNLTPERLVIQSDDEERFAHYKGYIRGQFARNSSVFFIVPTIEDVRQSKVVLERGIESYSLALHSKLTKKEFGFALSKIQKEKHPLLIIGTPAFLSLPRKDLGGIVVEKESSRAYRLRERPYFDFRFFIASLAKNLGVPVLLGDTVLSLPTIWKTKKDEYSEYAPLKMRVLSGAKNLLVDMKIPQSKISKDETDKTKFRVLSPELTALIDRTRAENENLFISSARKGLSGVTVCGDCGQAVSCRRCGSPVTLYKRRDERDKNFFLCNKCGEEMDAVDKCGNCGSWRLNMLGIGIDRVEVEIKKIFPDLKLFKLEKESVKNEKKALEIVSKFESSAGSVLLGTELALFYLRNKIENVAVASIDSLFSIPDFRVSEKIFHSLLAMRELAQNVFLIQTRNAREGLFDFVLTGNIIDFYKREIAERERFGFPPFAVFIKISVEGRGASAEKLIEEISSLLSDFSPMIYKGFSPSPRGREITNILIKRDPSEWPDDDLISMLKLIPPSATIRVDPESLI